MRIGPTLLPLSLSNENQRRGARRTERARRCVKTWNFGRFSECVSNVKGCRVFIGIRMRGWGGCLTFGPAHPLSPVTPPRGALRPVTSSRPRHRRNLNSVSFICLIKAPTLRPFLGFRIFISQVGIQCCSFVWLGVQKKLCIPAWNSSLNHKIRYNCEEGPKCPHLKKSPHSVGWW